MKNKKVPKNEYYLEINENSNKIKLPSELIKEKKEKRKKYDKYIKTTKYFIYSLIGLSIYFFYKPVLLYLLNLLKSNPTTYSYFSIVESNISNKTIIGLFFTSILGSLFFLILPSEAIFIYYLSSTNYNFIIIIIMTILGSLVGLTFNYFFGLILGEKIIKLIFKKNFFKYKEKVENLGGYFLFFGNIFPGPIEVLSIFYGSFKFQYKRFIYLSFIGRLIKYLLLFIAFYFFWDQITLIYNYLIQLIHTII